jgi:XRE family transcriptional regulator, regulator of sulfur utilization
MQGLEDDKARAKQALGGGLRALRLCAGLTQEQLAERAGVNASYLSQLESGNRDTGWTTVMRLLGALDATLSDLQAAIPTQ